MTFLESPRFPDKILLGSSGGPTWSTDRVRFGSGASHKNANWAAPLMRYHIAQTLQDQQLIDQAYQFFLVCQGPFVGFRLRDPHDHHTAASLASPISHLDQPLGSGDGSALALALAKTYAKGALSLVRPIKKPVAGSVVVGVSGVPDPRWSVNATTGIATAQADITAAISAITRETQAVVSAPGHGLAAGQSIHIDAVAGMSAINGTRAAIVAVIDSDQLRLDHDTSGYSAYSSGGTLHTLAQAGEPITWGGEFDVPVEFDVDELPIRYVDAGILAIDDLPLVEIRNP